MAFALRRSSVAGAVSLLILLAPPVDAAAPLALFAKQIIQGIIKDFFKSQLTSLVRETLGPCKSMIADMGLGAVGTVRGLASGGGVSGALGAQAMDPALRAQMMQRMPGVPEMQGMDPAMQAQVAQMMAGMQSAAPLSGDEVDELVNRLVAFSKAVPDQPLPCSPEDLKLVFNMTASMPMASGPFRMMLTQFRAMDAQFAEVKETFAKMSSAEQSEAVDLMLADAGSMSAEERKQLAGFLQSDLFGLPPAVREQFRTRLARLP
jgi:hypothetical protein